MSTKKKVIISIIVVDIVIIYIFSQYHRNHELLFVAAFSFLFFILNIIIGILFCFFRKSKFFGHFVLNGLMLMFSMNIATYIQARISYATTVKECFFEINNEKYRIYYFDDYTDNYIADDELYYNVIHQGVYEKSGKVNIKNDAIYLTDMRDSSQYYIFGDYLYNFENIDSIKLIKNKF